MHSSHFFSHDKFSQFAIIYRFSAQCGGEKIRTIARICLPTYLHTYCNLAKRLIDINSGMSTMK